MTARITQEINVLLIEDNPDDSEYIAEMLSGEKDHAWKIERAGDLSEGMERLSQGSFDVVLLDLSLPDSMGLDTLIKARAHSPQTPFVVLTGLEDNGMGETTVRNGAEDYLVKGRIDCPHLSSALRFSIERARLGQRKNGAGKKMIPSATPKPAAPAPTVRPKWRKSAEGIIYASESIRKILEKVDRIARETVPVLIYGETGTGKELISSAIHHNTYNPRKEKPFISINCASLSENLLESELFGYVRGAFTGAIGAKQGILEAIDGGTLFLDEIPDASRSVQAKLLRVLDCGEYLKLGETRVRKVDVRILAATNKNLAEEIAAGRFREDLFQRLNVVTIYVPPLSERPEDIPILIDFFLDQFNRTTGKNVTLSDDARRFLIENRWIGNIRELKHMIQNLCIMADSDAPVIRMDDVTSCVSDQNGNQPEGGDGTRSAGRRSPEARRIKKETLSDVRTQSLQQAQKDYIIRLLKENRGNVTISAKAASISRRYLTKLVKDFGIHPKRFKPL